MRLSLLAIAFVTIGAAAPSAPVDLTVVKADLRKVLVRQEAYYADHSTYTADISALQLTLTDSVVVKITEYHPNSYAAVGFVKGNETASCVFFINQVSSMPKTAKGKVAEAEGGIICDE